MGEKVLKIYGEYKGKTEELDEAYNKKQAEELAREYRIAFGPDWRIWYDEYEYDD